MSRKTLYGKEAREKLLLGVKKITDAIRVTLGPTGRCVIIAPSTVVDYGVHSLPLHSTKDGFTVAKNFDADDAFERAGVMLIKESTAKTVDQAGDGTSTCAILAHAMAEKGIELIDHGANPMELKRSIDDAVEYIVGEIKKMAVQVGDDNEKLFNIATISANNDPEIGRIISDAYKKIGKEGVIDIDRGQSVSTTIKMADGYRFDRSWISPFFITNKEKLICEYENPLILLYEKKITHHDQFERAILMANQRNRPIIIICEDAEGEGLGVLVTNTFRKALICCVVKAPSFGEARRIEMEDIATLTGGTYISDSKGVGIKEIEFENLGQADKILITRDETIIIGGHADQEALDTLIGELKMNLTQAKNEEEAAPIEKRIAKLQGGIAVIEVGAHTETEQKEKMDRFDDAVRATKAAISEGYVAGGGTAFLRIRSGNEIVDYATESIIKQIAENTGTNGTIMCTDISRLKGNMGYNAKTGEVQDLVEAGVIDPAKVLRCALQNAASSAGVLLTTEALIVDNI